VRIDRMNGNDAGGLFQQPEDLIAEVLYISFLAVEKNPEKCVKHINIYLLY